jgi:quinol-cytochrome oxidoreductase complex cytochrome b subunit
MWRVRKDGGLACVDRLALAQKAEKVEPARTKTYSLLGITAGATVHLQTARIDEDKHTVQSSPELTRRLATVTVATVALATILTLLFAAPLEEPANPSVTPNPAKAPWYFLWLQELVTDTTFTIAGFTFNGALVGGIIVPGLLVVWLFVSPYLDKTPLSAVGVWWAKERRKHNITFLAIVLAIVVLTLIGTLMRGPYWNFYWPWESWPELPRRL